MAVLKTIRLRIQSIRNTQQITKAMKMVAASKLRKSQQAMEALRPFAENLEKILNRLSDMENLLENPFYKDFANTEKRVRVIVLSTDKGLCGPLNTNVFKKLDRYLEEKTASEAIQPSLVLFGKKAIEHYEGGAYTVLEKFSDLKENMLKEQLLQYIRRTVYDYAKDEYDSLMVVYNDYISIIKQETNISVVLPLSKTPEPDHPLDLTMETGYEFEPRSDEILKELIPLYVESKVLRALLENSASEQAARMTAMDAATKNAGEILTDLKLQYNRARQASITKELIEIISGAESLN